MCELFGLTGPDELTVNEYLKTFFQHSTEHPNGWGLAIFRGNEVNIEKEPVPAFRSKYLKERLKSPICSGTLMGHIRFATHGHMEYDNCHPFMKKDISGRSWTFMHNGTIFDCPLLDRYFYTQLGQTDSERIALCMIDRINEETVQQGHALTDRERFDVINRTVFDITAHNKVNFMLYDGDLFYVHKNMKNSMFVKCLGQSLLFATSPLDDQKWEPVPLCQLQAYKNGRLILTGTIHPNESIADPKDMKLIFLDYATL